LCPERIGGASAGSTGSCFLHGISGRAFARLGSEFPFVGPRLVGQLYVSQELPLSVEVRHSRLLGDQTLLLTRLIVLKSSLKYFHQSELKFVSLLQSLASIQKNYTTI
jgi:hypothetical protein